MPSTEAKYIEVQGKRFNKKGFTLSDLYSHDNDPIAALQNGKIMAKAWARTLEAGEHEAQAQSFVFNIIEAYWKKVHEGPSICRSLPVFFNKPVLKKQDSAVIALAQTIGSSAAKLDVVEAGYILGTIYTAVMSETTRSARGVFYTPPALTQRLIGLAEKAGIDWTNARIIDPACGGGAFLAPVCLRMLKALQHLPAKEQLVHIQNHLTGWEIDAFGGWLSQVFVEVVLKDVIKEAGIKLPPLIHICNSLEVSLSEAGRGFDLVIGNPPYGKVKLTDAIRTRFKESLYGHPNYYGLFTHLATELASNTGVIAFLTPTSFLSGEYFKQLRVLLREKTNPLEIDFVSFRKGVFDDVLQETMLAIYSNQKTKATGVVINQITTGANARLEVSKAGKFTLDKDLSAPWILPRVPRQADIVASMKKMTFRLSDWGYKISTGPLVWNRHKEQLLAKMEKSVYPVIWSESVTQDGRFVWKAEKKNHVPYFKFLPGDEWLVTTKPCILLQRTTAKEQDKRLIAAALPEVLLQQKKGVIIENHLNMIIPIVDSPLVTPEVLAAFLNSRVVNEAFRTISGSVAVSAYELEALPLPEPKAMKPLLRLLSSNTEQEALELACQQIYNP